jgi:very-short-patch-repair endonuclease
MNKPIHSRKTLKENRNNLRKNLTPAEATLWKAIKGKQLKNRKFIRQHSIENYIADFYCPEEMLVIELDGHHHYTTGGMQNDFERDTRLTELGFKILRFGNKRVFEDIEGVLEEIARHFKR